MSWPEFNPIPTSSFTVSDFAPLWGSTAPANCELGPLMQFDLWFNGYDKIVCPFGIVVVGKGLP